MHKAVNDQVVKRAEVDSLLTLLFRDGELNNLL